MHTSARSGYLHCSRTTSLTSRTAVYGPVCTVVWQGSAGDCRPYADQLAFPGNGKPRWSEGRIAELGRKIGQQVLEIVRRGGLKRCLQRIEEQRMLQLSTGNPQSTGRSRKR